MPSKYLDYNGLDYFWDQVKSYVATSIIGKANDSDVVHKSGNESIAGIKAFTDAIRISSGVYMPDDANYAIFGGGKSQAYSHGAKAEFFGSQYSSTPSLAGGFALLTGGASQYILYGLADGTLTWRGSDITGDAHLAGDEVFTGIKTFNTDIKLSGNIYALDNLGNVAICGGKSFGNAQGAKGVFYGASYPTATSASSFELYTGAPQKILAGKPDGTLTWNGADVTGDAHLAGTETFTGLKYFSGGLYSLTSDIHCVNNNYDFSNLSTVYQNTYYQFKDSAMLNVAAIQSHVRDNQFGLRFLMRKIGDTTTTIQNSFGVALWYYTSSGNAYFLPTNKALVPAFGLGAPSNGWSEVFADNATINTSDERLKESIAGFPDEVLDAWGDVGWVQYQMSEAVQRKGVAARLHSGMIAQRAASAFRAHGLDASRYGFFCHDEWEANEEDGIAAGDKYSVRYAEALCIEAAYMRRENARLKERLALLEERVAALLEA